jgi:hypothetical protein
LPPASQEGIIPLKQRDLRPLLCTVRPQPREWQHDEICGCKTSSGSTVNAYQTVGSLGSALMPVDTIAVLMRVVVVVIMLMTMILVAVMPVLVCGSPGARRGAHAGAATFRDAVVHALE